MGDLFEQAFDEVEGDSSFTITHGFNTRYPEVHVLIDGPAESKTRFTNYTINGIYPGVFVINLISPPISFIVAVKP